MSGKYLLDTNIIIALFAEDPFVQKHIAKAGEIFIPATVIGELYFGVFKSGRPKANTARIENFAASNSVLACDIGTCRKYGYIKNLLHKKGHPIPENDIWIAALAMEHGLTLVSRDEHFKMINELKRVAW
ncbi:MAG: type II toxin-antitoxin system VapC family toxin [Proteobacteria bacterium]|nr:type II toxin-antitoxin system VapC family toxin [Pseudomonadota bacterium]